MALIQRFDKSRVSYWKIANFFLDLETDPPTIRIVLRGHFDEGDRRADFQPLRDSVVVLPYTQDAALLARLRNDEDELRKKGLSHWSAVVDLPPFDALTYADLYQAVKATPTFADAADA